MFRVFRRTIARKLAVTVIVAVLCAVTIAAVASAWRDAQRHLALTQDQLTGIAHTLAASISEPMADGRWREVSNALRAVRNIETVQFVRALDASDRNVASFGTGVLLRQPEARHTLVQRRDAFAFLSLTSYPTVVPVIHSGRTIGSLEIISDISHLRTAFWDSLLQSITFGLIASLLAVLVSYRLQDSIVRPLRGLADTMRDVTASGAYERRMSATSIDETAHLVDAFNAMLGEIEERDADLRRHRDQLEDKVRERTQDLHDAKLEADAANAAKSDFLATMSHEIRTPMNGMLVMAELLAAGELAPRAQRYCEVMLKSGKSLLSIIDDILDFSKVEAGKLDLEAVEISPADVVDDVVALFGERAASKNLELACHVSREVPDTAIGDPVRLNQILTNLVNNALKFTETGGVFVALGLSELRDGRAALCFSVRDTGIGIAQDKLEHVFDSFTQAEQSTTRRFGGTGIGLAICQKLVAAMGGQISVESILEVGTLFKVETPLELTAGAEGKGTAEPEVLGKDGRPSVQIELANGPSRDAVVAMARDAGFRVCSGPAEGSPAVVIGDALYFNNHASNKRDAADAITRLCVVGLGDSRGDTFVAAGLVDGVLERPLGTRASRELIAVARNGRSAVVSASDARTHAASTARVRFDGVRVLAADDSAINREVLTEALGRLGVSVVCVEDGLKAIEMMSNSEHGFDLVFMDGSMPGMDGYEATHQIRSIEARTGSRPVPIVALTAHVVGRAADEWYACGATDYVAKPFTLDAIGACLERCLVPSDALQIGESESDHHDVNEPSARIDEITLIDETTLASIKDMQSDGDNLLERVVELYLSNAPALLERVESSFGEGGAALASAAHALKSLSRSIGASRVAQACDQIETDARAGTEPGQGELSALKEAVNNTEPALRQLLSTDLAA